MSGYDSVVIGAGINGLVAAIALARSGSRVLVLERGPEAGGTFRPIEFAPGFRAAPLAPDLGWVPPDVVRGAGLTGALSDVVVADPTLTGADGEGHVLPFGRDPAATARAIGSLSAADRERWPRFLERLDRLAGFLGVVSTMPAPRIDASALGDLAGLARIGRKLKGLGRVEMIELLRSVPMPAAEVLGEWFESDLLQGALAAGAVQGLCQGPRSGGTGFTLLHHHIGTAPGSIRSRLRLRGGPGELVRLLAERLAAVGGDLRVNTEVAAIDVVDEAVTGVTLADGQRIEVREVLSTVDPRRTLLGLLDPLHLDPETIDQVRNIRYRGSEARVLLALDGLPDAAGQAGEAAGAWVLAPSIDYVERAYDATKYGQLGADPVVGIRFPSVSDEATAPAGRHVGVLDVPFAPYHLRSGWTGQERARLGDLALAAAERVLPGLSARVRERVVMAPPDLEAEFGMTEGAVSDGEMMLDQILFMRPIAGWSRYVTPVRGLLLAGSGTHPGHGITGAPGWLAAQAALRARAT